VPGHDPIEIEVLACATGVVGGGGDEEVDARAESGDDAQVVLGFSCAAGLEVGDEAQPEPALVPQLVVAVQVAVHEDGLAGAGGAVALCHLCTRRSVIGMLRWSDGECQVVESDAEPVSAGGVSGDVVVAAAQGSARRRDRRRGSALSGGVSVRASAGAGSRRPWSASTGLFAYCPTMCSADETSSSGTRG